MHTDIYTYNILIYIYIYIDGRIWCRSHRRYGYAAAHTKAASSNVLTSISGL